MAWQETMAMHTPMASISWTFLPFLLVSWIVISSVYRIFLHPLRHIPGPLRTKFSSLWLLYHQYIGDQSTAIHRLHSIYGPVVRVAPNEIDIGKSDALGPIYVDQGGFDKAEHYSNFNILGHATIFSTLSAATRSSRVKAVAPLFSTQSIREARGTISEYANNMVRRMGVEAKTGHRVDILKLVRAFGFDAVSAYILQQPYGGLKESSALLSAYPFIDFINLLGGYFWVSHSLLVGVLWLVHLVPLDNKTKRSIKSIELYLESLMNQAKAGGSSFQDRLLAKGMPTNEVAKECADILFAGTDTVGHILATICWNLVANPEQYALLRHEIKENTAAGSALQSLPYLNGVIKEGLRVSMAKPSRMPRVVPKPGWNYGEYYIPERAIVGVGAFELHWSPYVFPQPEKFLPERWLNATSEMSTNLIPFGKGARSCLGRNFATTELLIATEAIVRADVLQGAKRVKDKIEIYEWFNCRVKDGVIELTWNDQ
ncbi:hypothetical protein MMC07_006014 [Pseudocyphellaria aurata]|nr:hypothetical protein [Pseudocyphellaria aurata]